MGRLTQLHVYLIGMGLAIVVGAGLYFFLVHRAVQDLDRRVGDLQRITTEVNNAAQTPTELAETMQHKRDHDRRTVRLIESKRSRRATLNLISDEPYDWLASWWRLPQRVVPLCRRYAVLNPNNVRVSTNFSVGQLTVDPNLVPRDVIAWNLGTMVVRGRFQDVMAWVRRWNKFELLVAVDGLNLVKVNRTDVQSQCTLTVYLFPITKPGTPPTTPGAGGGMGGPPGMGAPGFGGVPGMGGPPGMGAPGNAPGFDPTLPSGGPPGLAPGNVP